MSEWKESELKEIGQVVSGGTPSTAISAYWNGDIPFITPYDLSKIKSPVINDTQRKITKEGLEASSANVLPVGSIVISSRAPIGYIAITGKKAVTNQGCKSIIPFSGFDASFLYYNFNFYVERIKRLGEGTTFAEISKADLELVKFPYPLDKNEQRKIAHILTTLDGVIEQTRAAIAKYKAIKQGLLHDLFTRGIDLKTGKLRAEAADAPELYKESVLGLVPKEWDVKALEEVTDYVDYRGKTPPKSDFGVYLVTARNIKQGFIDYETSKEYIRADAFESAMSRGKVKLGDVLITTEAPMGNVAQIDKEDVALAQRVIKYRGNTNKLNNDFLAKFLMSEIFQRALIAEATGSTVLGIKGSRLHQLKIILPNLAEQQLIANAVKIQEQRIELEQTYLTKLQSIKSGLMSDLLSGVKRVLLSEGIK
jgi:type I restriction enzyme, S subunit